MPDLGWVRHVNASSAGSKESSQYAQLGCGSRQLQLAVPPPPHTHQQKPLTWGCVCVRVCISSGAHRTMLPAPPQPCLGPGHTEAGCPCRRECRAVPPKNGPTYANNNWLQRVLRKNECSCTGCTQCCRSWLVLLQAHTTTGTKEVCEVEENEGADSPGS